MEALLVMVVKGQTMQAGHNKDQRQMETMTEDKELQCLLLEWCQSVESDMKERSETVFHK